MASSKHEQVRSSRPKSGSGLKYNSLPDFLSKNGTKTGQIISLDDLLQAILEATPKEKKMYFFKPIPGVDYRSPKLSRGNAGWFVFYYVKDPGTGRLRRIRIKLNHIKTTRERERVAREMISALGERLALGWNPLRDTVAPRSGVGAFDAYEAFLAAKKKEAEAQSVASYRSYVKVFTDWLRENGFSKDRPIGCVSHETAVAFMDHLDAKEGISPRTWNNYLSFLMTLHAWLIDKGYLGGANPFAGIRRKPKRLMEKRRRMLTADELARLVAWLETENPEFLAVVLLCYCCFVRPKEIALLRCRDLQLDRQLLFVGRDIAKNDRDSVRTIPDAILPALRRLDLSHPDWALFGKNAGDGDDFRPARDPANQRKFAAYWSLRVRPALGFPDEVQLYSLKDTGITNMATSGVPINLVQQQADHSSVAITSIYLGQRRAKAVEELKAADILPVNEKSPDRRGAGIEISYEDHSGVL